MYETQATHRPVGQIEPSANRIRPVCAEDPFAPIIGILLNHILPATPIQMRRNHADFVMAATSARQTTKVQDLFGLAERSAIKDCCNRSSTIAQDEI